MRQPDELYYETLRKLIESGYDVRTYVSRSHNSRSVGRTFDQPIIDCSIHVSLAYDDKGDLDKVVETRDTLQSLLGEAFEVKWESINGSFDIIHDKFVVMHPARRPAVQVDYADKLT